MKIKSVVFLMAMLMSHLLFASDYDERSLGKLFTTPFERQKIDSEKRGEVVQSNLKKITPSTVRVNGLLIRSKGKNSVWVNGHKAQGNQTIGGVKVFSDSVKSNLKVPILIDGKSVRIKPGQSWSAETGVVADSY